MTNIRWTDEKLTNIAAEFKTRGEFNEVNRNAYVAAQRRGLLDQICKHMEPQRISWTDEMVREAALNFKTLVDFQKGNRKAYRAAERKGILYQVCHHMKKQLTDWTYDILFDVALEFNTRVEFKKSAPNAYKAASSRGILDQICLHMESQLTEWTDKMLSEIALEFNSRMHFAKSRYNAYQAANRRGLMDEICSHMERGATGFNPEERGSLYVVSLDSVQQSYIGFGISNDHESRLTQHRRSITQYGFSFVVMKVLEFENGKDAADLERKLKRKLPIVNIGINGFRTEAILASDYSKLEAIINDQQT